MIPREGVDSGFKSWSKPMSDRMDFIEPGGVILLMVLVLGCFGI
jgi:hypothetical protein